jgi:hypothetical protein
MVIGKHAPKTAQEVDLKRAIAVGLDEAFTALEEAFYDLEDEQLATFPLSGQNNMAWIVMHCLENLDEYANGAVTGRRAFEHEWRWDLWQCELWERPRPGDPFPSKEEMLSLLRQVREAALEALETLDKAALTECRFPHPQKKCCADFYMRTIYHTMAHTRDLWLLRGMLGLGSRAWPQQHWT